jgi:hypothetical protein
MMLNFEKIVFVARKTEYRYQLIEVVEIVEIVIFSGFVERLKPHHSRATL